MTVLVDGYMGDDESRLVVSMVLCFLENITISITTKIVIIIRNMASLIVEAEWIASVPSRRASVNRIAMDSAIALCATTDRFICSGVVAIGRYIYVCQRNSIYEHQLVHGAPIIF